MINIIDKLLENSKIDMKKCIDNFQININKIHIGRVSLNIVDAVEVEYYGILTPLSQLANIVVEDSRTLAITVFDVKIIKLVEKAILLANLGLAPITHGNIIRVVLPILTEERRRSLIKIVRAEAEKSKISVRNIRRISNDKIKVIFKNKEINEDEEHDFQNKIQKLTNVWIKEIDLILKNKECELMQF